MILFDCGYRYDGDVKWSEIPIGRADIRLTTRSLEVNGGPILPPLIYFIEDLPQPRRRATTAVGRL